MKSMFAIGGCVFAVAFVAAQTGPVDDARIAAGRRLFTETCANEHCHGGSARSVVEMSSLPPERIREVIIEGLPDAGMQSFKEVFSAQEIDDIVAYIRSASAERKSEDRTCAHLR